VGVIIGMDPHKRSATIEVVDERGRIIDGGRFGTDKTGYVEMLDAGRHHPDRVWAVEGCNGIGKHIAHRLVHDGEVVFDVPSKLSTQVRVFATGNGRKTDPVDAHSVAMVALRTPNLVRVEVEDELVVMAMLVDRRDELGQARTQTINRLHRLLLELFPGGAPKFLSSHKARAMIATIKPRDIVGKTRRRLAVELITELEAIDKKIKGVKLELRELIAARGSTLMELTGIGPSGAARLLVDVGDIHRFADRDKFASWNGTAPLDASSGDQKRHRLSRAGTGASTGHCTSWPSSNCGTRPKDVPTSTPRRPPARPRWSPCARSNDASPTSSTPTCSPINNDVRRRAREGNRDTTDSSATGSHPYTGSSDKPLPGPVSPKPRTTLVGGS
jgi:transposase